MGESPELLQDLKPSPPSRGYIDGAFDLVHCGHFNAIRQAALICDVLVVGCNAEEGIRNVKGPPVLTSAERGSIIDSCKWVNTCEKDTEYTLTEKVLDSFNCQFYIHGDDPCYGDDGVDMCQYLAGKGRFK